MTSAQQNLPEMHTEAQPSPLYYLALLAGLPVLLMAGVLFMASTDWFFYHSYFGLQNIGYSLSLHHADCQVVLTGDSSALTGLDPFTVTRVTGLSACNVAEGGTVTVVTGSYPLDTYLKQNAPPKYIVFMNTPSIYTPPSSSSWDGYGSYNEGIVYLLRYERGMGVYKKLLGHPAQTYQFISWAVDTVVANIHSSLVNPHKYDGLEDPALRRVRQGGRFTYYSAAQTSCTRNGWDKKIKISVNPDWVAGLRTKYGVNGTRVLVNVAPVADCDDMKDVYVRMLQGMHDNRLEVLPIGMFNSQDVHFTAEGAEAVSTEVGKQILADEKFRIR
jgi:hypothetical protein